jgi:hypothetical protein
VIYTEAPCAPSRQDYSERTAKARFRRCSGGEQKLKFGHCDILNVVPLLKIRPSANTWLVQFGVYGIVALFLAPTACKQHQLTPQHNAAIEARQAAAIEARAEAKKRDDARQQLDQIPPPAKSRYLAVRSTDGWGNPFVVVGKNTVTLKIMFPDLHPADSTGVTGFLKPTNARRRELVLHLKDLPDALAALPESAWPYGRVIAIEEDTSAPKPDRPQVRRQVESTIQMLNDLSVVVDEWTGPNGSLLR